MPGAVRSTYIEFLFRDNNIKASLRGIGAASDKTITSMGNLDVTGHKAQKRIADIAAQAAKTTASQQRMADQTQQLAGFFGVLDTAEKRAINSQTRLGRVTNTLRSNYNRLSTTVRGAATELGKMNKAALGGAMTGLGYGARRIVQSNTLAFAELDTQMARVRKTTGMTKDEIAVMRTEFIGMSKEVPTAASELAKIGAVAGQLGITGKEDILEFTDTVEKMSIAFDISAESAAIALAKLSNIYGIAISETDRLASAINVLGNTTAAKESEIIEFTQALGPAADMMGFTATESVAMGATMIAMGRDASSSGTLLNSAFVTLAQNTDKASKLLGMNEEQFKAAFGEDPMLMLQLLMEEIGKIEDPLEQSTVSAEIFNIRGGKAIMSMSASIDDLNTNLDNAAQGYEENISLIEEYANATDTFASKQQIANNKMEAARIEMGEAMAPAVLTTAGALGILAGGIEALPGPLQTVIGLGLYLAQVLLMLGPILIAIAVLEANTAFSSAALATSLWGVAAGVWAVLAPLLPFIALGAILILIIQDLWTGIKGGESVIFGLGDKLLWLLGPIGYIIYAFKNFDKIVDFLVPAFTKIIDKLKGFDALFKEAGLFLIDTFIKGMTFGLLDTKKLTAVFNGIREYLPFSDAKKGPLSDLTLSGQKFMQTFAKGAEMQNGLMGNVMTMPAKMIGSAAGAIGGTNITVNISDVKLSGDDASLQKFGEVTVAAVEKALGKINTKQAMAAGY